MLSIAGSCLVLCGVFLLQGQQLWSSAPAVREARAQRAAPARAQKAPAPKITSTKTLVAPPTPEERAAIAALAAEKLSDAGLSREAYAFKQRVYELHAARGTRSGRKRIYDLPAAQLATIPSTNIKMRRDAALQLGRLLAAARTDLARDLAAAGNDAPTAQRRMRARRVRGLAISNAYRSASRQFGIWDRNFLKYYQATQEKRSALPGGEHGAQAADLLREYIGVRVAAPGFSNHQGGIAVDLALQLKPDPQQPETQAERELSASMAQADPWKESWFWHWLKARAAEFGFVEYEPEPWHWEYKPQQASQEIELKAKQSRPQ